MSDLDIEELKATRDRNFGVKNKITNGMDFDCDYIHKSQLLKVLNEYEHAEANEENAMDFYYAVYKLLNGDAGIKEEDTLEKRINEKLVEINDAIEEESEKNGPTIVLNMLSYGQELLEELLKEV